jgi:hypothetical protein
MSLPQAQAQIAADLAQRVADHQQAIASALANGVLYQPNSPLVLLSDGDSWFDYPLNGFPPLIATTDIIAQLPALCNPKPFILNLSHYGDATTTELGLTRVQKVINALTNPCNGPFDAILFSGGGNDIVGDPFCIWLNDASSVGDDPAQALNMPRFNAVLDLAKASYEDLIGVRNDNRRNAPIFVHAYDFAIPSGIGASCGIGPWLKPSLDYCGWADPAQAAQIVKNALTLFGQMLANLANVPANNMIYIQTQGTLNELASWDNELHPKPPGFVQFATLFKNALAAKFPGRI